MNFNDRVTSPPPLFNFFKRFFTNFFSKAASVSSFKTVFSAASASSRSMPRAHKEEKSCLGLRVKCNRDWSQNRAKRLSSIRFFPVKLEITSRICASLWPRFSNFRARPALHCSALAIKRRAVFSALIYSGVSKPL